jgi:O-methyltransferase domain
VLIIEFVVPESRGPHISKFMDINMMMNTSGGRERTEREFTQLLAAAGLRLQRIVPTAIQLCLLECVADSD